MKKLITLLAILAIAGVASADLVNGDFSVNSNAGANELSGGDVDDGWLSNLNPAWFGQAWDISSGAAVRNTSGGMASIGQYFTHDLTAGSYTLDFDYVIGGNSPLIQLWVMDRADLSAALPQVDFYNTNTPGSGVGITVTELVNSSTLSGTGSASLSFTLAADMDVFDALAIRINTATGNGGPSFDNVQIIPEPATFGMVGLGAFAALVLRRFRI